MLRPLLCSRIHQSHRNHRGRDDRRPQCTELAWYIGMERGFFAEAGITLDLVYVPSAAGLVQQLSAGSLDIVADVGVVEPIHAIEKGAPVALLRIIGQVSPYAMLAKPGITSIKDLKGKTICIGGLLDINRVYLERIMQANGLHDGDYDITVVGNTAGRFAALKSGAVDATMLTPPAIFFAEDAGFRNVGMILDYTKDLPFSAMDVSLAYARTHRDTLAKLLVVIDRSVAWFNEDAHRDEFDRHSCQGNEVEPRSCGAELRLFSQDRSFCSQQRRFACRLQSLVNEMKALGDIKRDVDLELVVMPNLARLVD